jgi:hypothetical protein
VGLPTATPDRLPGMYQGFLNDFNIQYTDAPATRAHTPNTNTVWFITEKIFSFQKYVLD